MIRKEPRAKLLDFRQTGTFIPVGERPYYSPKRRYGEVVRLTPTRIVLRDLHHSKEEFSGLFEELCLLDEESGIYYRASRYFN